ncbi:FxSxx-COOH system tetratricopeptide repeat protein [Actinoplanes flavus]|uniref:Tetratricopeptide repeat protein n=1 Tax=Actinoplanes flavus TaxID=2820290 RepID=A0ABS3UMS3_9ACTN|nr:FxSxx-COOH system tetratricopeptide repeat protein [Actinoplanes flavus]MBO3740080.1 tetratricopeptide repeat protein [Actinoplanes flavus]
MISNDVRIRGDLADTVSHETVSAMLRGDGLPKWVKLDCVVRVLAVRSVDRRDPHEVVRQFLQLWLAASDDSTRPAVAPPSEDFIVPEPVEKTAGEPGGDPATVTVRPRDLPERNSAFTGRDLILDEVRRRLRAGRSLPVILHGLGGAGKTQVAVEYLYRWAVPENGLVWWVPAHDPMPARRALADLGERLNLPANRDLQQTVRSVISELERGRVAWHLVFDNAELSDDLLALLPSSARGQVLVTSRDPNWANVGTAIEVPPFDRAESIQFLRRRGREISGADADRLADRLGDLPLALEQVAAVQAATLMPVGELMQLFNEHMQELLATGRPQHYTDTVVAFVRIAVDGLRHEAPSAAQLLEVFAYLGTEPVSVTLLRSGQDAPVTAPLARALSDPIQMARTIRTLRRYGLATVEQQTRRITVHRLVQVALREALDQPARKRGRTNAELLLAAANPGAPEDMRAWDLYAEIAPHVIPAGLIGSAHLPARRLVVDQIRYQNRAGDYAGSLRLADLAIAAWTPADADDATEPVEELAMRATFERAETLRALGRYDESRELSIVSWNRLRESTGYGDRHRFTLRAARTVAAHHRINGAYPQALEVDEETLAHCRAADPADEERILHQMNNVGVNRRLLGDYRSAFAIDEEVLRRRRDLFGDRDARTLLSIGNLARDHLGLGDYQQAYDLQQEVLPALRARMGPRHQQVLMSVRTVVVALRKLGRYADAMRLARENYEAGLTQLGTDHEHTLAAMMSLANVGCALAVAEHRPPDDALELAKLAVARYRRVFGRFNPVTLAAEVNHAIILRALGDPRALEMDRMTLTELQERLGDEHPYTLCAAANYATDLSLDQQFDDARDLLRRTLEVSQRVRGKDHPDSLACAVDLVLEMRNAGESGSAQVLLDTTLGSLRRVLGPHHPSTVNAALGVRAECDIEPPPT